MSTHEEVGRITISFPAKGPAEVKMLGTIPARAYNSLPSTMRKAHLKHVASIRRGVAKADMSDTGKKLKDYESEDEFKAVQPAANPVAAEGIKPSPVPLSVEDILPKDTTTEAKDSEPEISEGVQDGDDSGSEEVRGDDEEPGSSKGSWNRG